MVLIYLKNQNPNLQLVNSSHSARTMRRGSHQLVTRIGYSNDDVDELNFKAPQPSCKLQLYGVPGRVGYGLKDEIFYSLNIADC